jgi:hypothetical protein
MSRIRTAAAALNALFCANPLVVAAGAIVGGALVAAAFHGQIGDVAADVCGWYAHLVHAALNLVA